MAAKGETRQRRGFRQGTRQRMRQFATVPVGFGTTISTDLPRVGFLAGIFLTVHGTLTTSGPGGTTGLGMPYNILKRVVLNMNSGASRIYDTSGFGAFIYNDSMMEHAFFAGNNDIAAFPTAAGANNEYFGLYIPVALNNYDLFALGLINLQAPEVRCTLDLTFANAGTDVVSTFQSSNMFVQMTYIYYDVPDPRVTQFPPLVVHRVLEERQQIFATGDQVYTFPRGGTILQLAHMVTLNGALCDLRQGQATSGKIDGQRIVLNKTDTLYEVPFRAQAYWQAMNNGSGAPGEALLWNFLDAGMTQNGAGDFRDTINSEEISVLESIVTVNAAAAVGPGGAFLDSIRRIIQVLQA